MLRIRPYRGQYMSKVTANRLNDIFALAKKPDHTELKKEADEFGKLILERKAI